MEIKNCTKCGRDLPLDAFSNDPRKKDGKYSACKECHNRMTREWREKNKDKVKKYREKRKKLLEP